MRIRQILILPLFLSIATMIPAIMEAQDISWNDECQYAYYLTDVSDFCSDSLNFSNFEATPSPEPTDDCWPVEAVNRNKDVWISFIPDNTGLLVRLFGLGSFQGKSLEKPQIQILNGNCKNLTEVACGSVLFNENYIEINLSDIKVGTRYFLRVSAREGNVGSFRICTNTYPAIRSPQSDCPQGTLLCDKSPYSLDLLSGVGTLRNEVQGSCIQEEFASIWLKWIIKDPGSLVFTIFPNNNVDDLDFALYRLPNGIDDCNNKVLVRCMAAGETRGQSPAYNAPCYGPTGLREGERGETEQPGCDNGNNNFVSAVDAKEGEAYALIVNNFSQSGRGFTLRFGGTATFQGPDFEISADAVQAFECDKSIILDSEVTAGADPITRYTWSFGEGADIETANTPGPHNVTYQNYGDKLVALNVESSRGCTVTKILKFFVEPCCTDFKQVDFDLTQTQDIQCVGEENGAFMATNIIGRDRIKFFMDDPDDFRFNPTYQNLGAGTYTVYLEDGKGCLDTAMITLLDPPPVEVNAGEDRDVLAGQPFQLEGQLTPPGIEFSWIAINGCRLEDFDSTMLNQTITAYGITEFILQGITESGCMDIDTVRISALSPKSLYSPNVISANGDGYNDIFSLSNEQDETKVLELLIFDRWGNKVYESNELIINNQEIGWDGRFGQNVVPGVYAWVARIEFIDCSVQTYHGDLTVIR